MNRAQVLEALAAAGYSGTTSHTKGELEARLTALLGGEYVAPIPAARAPSAAKAKRLERKPWEVDLLSHSQMRTVEATATVAGQACPGKFHAYRLSDTHTSRCPGKSVCIETWIARGLVVDPDFIPYWKQAAAS